MLETLGLGYFILQYVPYPDRDDRVSIGILAIADDGAFAATRFLESWEKVVALDPDADLEVLASMTREMAEAWQKLSDRTALLQRMESSFSNAIQLSAKLSCQTSNPIKEVDTLAATYL